MPVDPLEHVIHCFQGVGFPFGLSASKIRDRAYVINKDTDEDWIVFVMDRHRGILGESYVPGTPMQNFVTERCQYSFDMAEETLEETSRHVIDAQIDADGAAENLLEYGLQFRVETVDGGFRVTEFATGQSRTVA